jgi:hypothetical protein
MSSSELIWDLIFIILQPINSKSNQISPIEPPGANKVFPPGAMCLAPAGKMNP